MTELPSGRPPLRSEQLGSVFRELCEEHAREQAGQHEATWAKIEARRERSSDTGSLRVLPAPTKRAPRLLLLASAALGCGLMAVGALSMLDGEPEELTFQVIPAERESQTERSGERHLIASEDQPVAVAFSDETRLTLRPHSTVRLMTELQLVAEDAEKEQKISVALSQGELEVSAPEKTQTEVRIEAGTFRLKALGASFVFGYVPETERMHLKTTSGTVVVTDAAGVTHRVSAAESLMLSSKPEAEPEVKAPEQEEVGPAAQVGPAARSGAPVVSYHGLAAEGKFAEIVSRARASGMDALLRSGSAADLQEVAQAARYTGELALAEQIWTRMISRFSGSAVAQNAHFFLGRLAEQQNSPQKALQEYEIYLGSGAGGVYTSAALGRKLSLVHQSQGVQKARPIAKEYLRAYPEGPYAKQARELLGAD